MKRFMAILVLNMFAVGLSYGQTPTDPDKDGQRLLELLQEVQTQQAQIVDNQTKIDTKMADLAESIRTARLFAGKAGK